MLILYPVGTALEQRLRGGVANPAERRIASVVVAYVSWAVLAHEGADIESQLRMLGLGFATHLRAEVAVFRVAAHNPSRVLCLQARTPKKTMALEKS